MEIEYFLVADSANGGPDGKVNALGIGVRVLSYERLPAATPLAILLHISARPGEVHEIPIQLSLTEPDGTREILVDTVAPINATVNDERVPTGINLQLGLVRPYRIEGVHRFEVQAGELRRSYDVVVRVGQLPEAPVAQT